MAKVTVKMNPGWERALEAQVKKSPQWARIQQDANEKARAILREVNERMTGQPVDDVLAELVAKISAAGFEPNRESLREYAVSISEGTLK